jgi:hypothetical protein
MKRCLPVVFSLLASNGFPQATEVEPNEPCLLAQDLGPISLPYMVSGALDALDVDGDVDFYRLLGTPNSGVQVDMEGQESGAGTLREPYLGLFDSNCRLLVSDSAGPYGTRSYTVIPSDGTLLIAATGCCDPGFHGVVGVGGTYRVMVRPIALARSIRGRVVDALSSDPLGGNDYPYARAELYRCTGSSCDSAASQSPSSDGVFVFEGGELSEPLFAGEYRIRFIAQNYEEAETPRFTIADSEERELADFPLRPLPRIGRIRGRVVDAATRMPLPGDDVPYTWVRLSRCEGSFCSYADQMQADAQGRYLFGDDPFWLLPPGTYQVEAEANEYRPNAGAMFAVGEGQDVAVPDLALEPFPIRFTELRPCGDLPKQGGICKFSARLVNQSHQAMDGGAWSLVQTYTGSLAQRTEFQAGPPKVVFLPPLGSRVVPFSFRIPATLQNGAYICTEMFFGRTKADYFFNTLLIRNLFCIQKGTTGLLRLLDEKEMQELKARFAPAPGRRPDRR